MPLEWTTAARFKHTLLSPLFNRATHRRRRHLTRITWSALALVMLQPALPLRATKRCLHMLQYLSLVPLH